MNKNVSSEYSNIKLGDKRLENRAGRIVQRLVENPTASFPNIFPNQAELEAFYRFVENPYIESEALFEGHRSATLERCERHEEIFLVHDTTKFSFSGRRISLKGSNGFFGHCTLALSGDGTNPLGVLRMETWVRDPKVLSPTALAKAGKISQAQARAMPSEMDRWLRGIKEVASQFSNQQKLIHVCDSEGDDYDLLSSLIGKHRFVVRGSYNRKLAASSELLLDVLKQAPFVSNRIVHVSKRPKPIGRDDKDKRRQSRDERVAKLSIHCSSVKVLRPRTVLQSLPEEISLNVVYVREVDPPSDVVPIEWILLSSESIATKEDVLRIVDVYRARWMIEEYFKALKTGCAFECRQLESYSTRLICMTLFVPIAWLMLSMRAESKKPEPIPAGQILPQVFIDVLQAHTKTEIATTRTALLAIASLGGHIKGNGSPGWLIIWRGFRELATMVRGFMLARDFFAQIVNKKM
jgi:hypothetical protein